MFCIIYVAGYAKIHALCLNSKSDFSCFKSPMRGSQFSPFSFFSVQWACVVEYCGFMGEAATAHLRQM